MASENAICKVKLSKDTLPNVIEVVLKIAFVPYRSWNSKGEKNKIRDTIPSIQLIFNNRFN